MTLIRCTEALASLALLLLVTANFAAAQKLNTAYISTTPGTSTVIQVAKEARLFDKHGIAATVIFIVFKKHLHDCGRVRLRHFG